MQYSSTCQVAAAGAAAKNFNHVAVLASKDDYTYLLDTISNQNGETTLAQRKQLAKKSRQIMKH